jgi:CRP/FNR family transcriptional regulator
MNAKNPLYSTIQLVIDQNQLERVTRSISFLQDANPRLLQEFQQQAYLASIPAGQDVFLEGDQVEAIALLISGVVRVYNIGVTGREITLYRFGLGDSCIISANAIFNQATFPAIATVEQEAEAVMIPADTFRDWVHRYAVWRNFIINLLSQRLSSLMVVIDEVAFQRMDTRIAAFLLGRSRVENPISITHQEIAAELGSSREVISRILEDYARQGVILTGRGTVEILDPGTLNELAQM